MAWWLSWLERRPVTAEVVGSNPIRVASSKEGIKYGVLAQLGEHLPYKQGVTGSSPVGPIRENEAMLRFFLCIENIGDGIRPCERRKGYATEMLRLALIECKKIGLQRVLMVCSTDNIGSAKSIINNGGVLENEITNADGV